MPTKKKTVFFDIKLTATIELVTYTANTSLNLIKHYAKTKKPVIFDTKLTTSLDLLTYTSHSLIKHYEKKKPSYLWYKINYYSWFSNLY